MADLAHVEQALAAACASALAPTGLPHRVHRGWPVSHQLDADLRAGTVTVSVYPQPGATRNVSRFSSAWRYDAAPAASLSLTVAGNTVTISGTPTPAHIAAVSANDVAYTRRCIAGDTPAAVAAGLAALIPGASAAGATLTVPGALRLQAHAVADWRARREVRRQEQGVQVTVWAPTPALRDAAAAAVDAALASGPVLALADGSAAWLRYQRTASTDEGTEALIYRRDLIFVAEYATTAEAGVPAVAAITRTLGPVDAPPVQTRVTVQPAP